MLPIDIGARAFEPMIDVQRAELARLDGDEAAWRARLRKAPRLFSEMGMVGRAEPVARELGMATTADDSAAAGGDKGRR